MCDENSCMNVRNRFSSISSITNCAAATTRRVQRYLRRQVELEPWHEEAHQQLMRLYARNEQRSRALIQFENCQRILRAELDVEPSP